jgi:hypothetical protein
MTRIHFPIRNGGERIDTAHTCCTGECDQGRRCPLVVPRVSACAGRPEPVRQRRGAPVQVTGGPIPRRRRARRFLRALWRATTTLPGAAWRFLTARKARL